MEASNGVVVAPRPEVSSQSALPHSSLPFALQDAKANLPFDVTSAVHLEITCNDQPLFGYMSRLVSKKVTSARSIRADIGRDGLARADDDMVDIMMCKGKGRGLKRRPRANDNSVKIPKSSLGLGWHSFEHKQDDSSSNVFVLRQRLGEPTGSVTGGGPMFFDSLVLFVEGADQTPLLKLCKEAIEAATMQKENRVSLYRFESKMKYWIHSTRRIARSLDSVVLDEAVKRPLMLDLEWFVKDDTRGFYAKHGIPYHRCYLFHGPPGAGKTSFIYALAGHLQRNLCFMQMDTSVTDDSFRTAMSTLPGCAMVVLEDVDSLFSNHREADRSVSSLSFSGFLNSLDGLGAPDDVVVCLTTNHPEKLDPAILRPGRIDVKVEFKTPNRDVAARYFLTFYPGEEKAAAAFSAAVGNRISDRKVSMAQLQHFFLACHRLELGAEKAAEHINEFVFDEIASSSTYRLAYC